MERPRPVICTRRANHRRAWLTGLSSPLRKNILIFRRPKSPHISNRPVPLEGRLMIVTIAGRDAVDAEALLTNSA